MEEAMEKQPSGKRRGFHGLLSLAGYRELGAPGIRLLQPDQSERVAGIVR